MFLSDLYLTQSIHQLKLTKVPFLEVTVSFGNLNNNAVNSHSEFEEVYLVFQISILSIFLDFTH